LLRKIADGEIEIKNNGKFETPVAEKANLSQLTLNAQLQLPVWFLKKTTLPYQEFDTRSSSDFATHYREWTNQEPMRRKRWRRKEKKKEKVQHIGKDAPQRKTSLPVPLDKTLWQECQKNLYSIPGS